MFNKETNQNRGIRHHSSRSQICWNNTEEEDKSGGINDYLAVIAKEIPNKLTLVYLIRLLTINFLQPFTSATYKI